MPDPLPPSASPAAFRVRSGLLFVAVTAAVLLFQTVTGVWTSDIGADPDEPAHAVTSLMVRDYLASGFERPPLAFAQRYYEDFPKVALGHYPPGYYALAGVALLPWPDPRALLVLQALLVGLLSVQVYVTGRRMLREPGALAAAFLCAGFPATLKLSQLVMADVLLACLCLLAVELWARFMEKPRPALALLFGCAAAAAILTKGSALALALVPAVSVPLMHRWDLLKKPAFWLAAVPVALLAGPWMLYSSKITQEGMMSAGVLEFATGAVKYYPRILLTTFGSITVLAALGGLAVWLGITKIRTSMDVRRASLLGLMLGTLLILLLVPTGYSSRYLMPLAPAAALLAISFFELTLGRTRVYQLGVYSLVLLVWLQAPGQLVKNVSGYRDAVLQALDDRPGGGMVHWLVSADARGEGAVVAAAAFATPVRAPSALRVHRATKELASADWLGRGYQAKFETPEAVLAWLDETGVTRIFIDVTAELHEASPHERLLLEALRDNARWRLEDERTTTRPYQAAPGRLVVYRRADG